MNKFLGCLLMLAVSTVCTSNQFSGGWSCLAYDHLNRSYEGSGASIRSGMASARRACIKSAPVASRCRVSHNWCQQGYSPLANNNCEAEDEVGKRFESRGKDACETALYQCEAWQQKLSPSDRHSCLIVHR